MKKVLVTYRDIPGGHILEDLGSRFHLVRNPSPGYMERPRLIEAVKDVHGLVPLLSEPIDAELMDAARSLEIVASYAVGYNNIDIAAATERGILVTNTPGVVTDATADLAWALIMAVARDIVVVDRYVRSGNWTEWRPEAFIASDITGTTLGVVGMGRIGQAVARRAKAFDMEVVYYDEHRLDNSDEESLGVRFVPFAELLTTADFVTVHVPLTPGTFHLVNESTLDLMKPTAYLINTSRGQVIDERALVHALQQRTIAGAGLDVYENEPKLEPGLAALDNVVLVPHLGANSRKTREAMARMTVANITLALEGDIPRNLVNPEALPHRRVA